MKRFSTLIFTAFAAPALAEGLLTEPEREALLEKIDALREVAETKVSSRFSGATSAFRQGMSSNSAALELYLKCVERVNFEEKNRSGQDFREWKRRNRNIDNKAFAMALRHQLNWFSLTLRAAANPDKIDKLAPEAAKCMESLLAAAEEVQSKAARDQLKKPVTETIFAQAYGLAGLQIKDWPMSPLPASEVYNKVILPPLRQSDTTAQLRAAWVNRIRFETLTMERWSGGGDRSPNDPLPPAYIKFLAETKPELMWQMEVDVFKAGDQQGAALRMLEHLEKNIAHHKATEWERTFRELVDPASAQPSDSQPTSDDPS